MKNSVGSYAFFFLRFLNECEKFYYLNIIVGGKKSLNDEKNVVTAAAAAGGDLMYKRLAGMP